MSRASPRPMAGAPVAPCDDDRAGCNTAEVDAPVIEPTPARRPDNGRYGITVPFDGVLSRAHREWLEELPELGYTDVWTGEASSADGFTPLALAAAWAPAAARDGRRARVHEGPWAARDAGGDPGRAGSRAVRPRHRHVVGRDRRALERGAVRRALQAGARHSAVLAKGARGGEGHDQYETFKVRGFRLDRRPAEPPPIYVAALRSGHAASWPDARPTARSSIGCRPRT